MRLWHHLPEMWVNRNVLVEQNNWCWFYEEGVSNNFSIYNFRLCYKLKRILHVSLKREPSKPTILLRDKIYKRTSETMYNKEMIKWVERRKLCTNLKIITFTCLCNAFTIPRTKFWKREWKTSLTNNFLQKEKYERIWIWTKWKGKPIEVVNVLGHS